MARVTPGIRKAKEFYGMAKAGPRCATVQAGVDALVKAGAINSPDYWLQNYGKLQSLDLLLCALGGAV